MKWFKHYSNASENHKIAVIEEKAGLAGYAAYFKIIEMCASAFDPANGPKFTFSLKQIQNKMRMKSKQTDLVLSLFSEQNLFQITRSEDKVIIDFPKLLEIKDNHTKDLQVTSKQLAPRIEENREEEKREDKNRLDTPKKNLPEKKSKAKRKTLTSSPLAPLFEATDEIQVWLLTGTEAVQRELLTKFSHHVLAEEVKKAYFWQLERQPRQAGTFLLTWMGNAKTSSYNPQTEKPRLTSDQIQLLKEAGQL